jgi:hypothetical protein
MDDTLVAILVNVLVGTALALVLGAIWGPVDAYATIGTAVTVVAIVIYILVEDETVSVP